jgi:protein tyrosine phosphatase (PTP) superfamily phosphohydrolase (DUF442 family)
LRPHETLCYAVLPLLILVPTRSAQQEPPAPLETIRNYQLVNERLASAGQIGYEQIPLLAEQQYDVVVNLATADPRQNAEEGFRVTQEGLTYIHIPVVWQEPTVEDVEMFFDVMRANEGRRVFVHCIANMRASAFLYLYRSLVEGVPEAEARATMNEVWDPLGSEQYPQWGALIRDVTARYSDRP